MVPTYLRTYQELEEEYRRQCSQLGISSATSSLRQEVIHLARDLPNTYADIAQQAKVGR